VTATAIKIFDQPYEVILGFELSINSLMPKFQKKTLIQISRVNNNKAFFSPL